MRVAIQGITGSFHDEATKKYFGPDITIVPANSFRGVFEALEQNSADQAVIAVENSLYGSINEVLDLVEKHSYVVTGEVFLHIEQHLIGLPKSSLNAITHVYSHPVALAQCDKFLTSHLPNAERIEYRDTAASVEFIKEQRNPAHAAIAGRPAAALHSLPILAENIEDNHANATRFWVLSRAATESSDQTDKASLVLTLPHRPGSLVQALSCFAEQGGNLTKLESRPIVGEPWHYRFYIDVEMPARNYSVAVQSIKDSGGSIALLGRYRSAAS